MAVVGREGCEGEERDEREVWFGTGIVEDGGWRCKPCNGDTGGRAILRIKGTKLHVLCNSVP